MEQLVILIIIGLISLVNWVLQKAAEKRELARMKREADHGGTGAPRRAAPAPPPLPSAGPRGPQGEDPLRELMEALGLPADAAAPPPVRPVPAPVVIEEEFTSLEDTPPPLPTREAPPRRPDPVWQAPAPFRPDEAMTRLASSFNAQQSTPAAADRSGVRSLLTGRESQRHAVILAEILGQPRALRPSDDWLPAGAR